MGLETIFPVDRDDTVDPLACQNNFLIVPASPHSRDPHLDSCREHDAAVVIRVVSEEFDPTGSKSLDVRHDR